MRDVTLHLASASPRRREILEALGLEFSYAGVDVDESPLPEEAADAMVLRLALAKAQAAATAGARGVVLGADTAVVLGERVFGKPTCERDAVAMLMALSNRTHEVLTGVAVLHEARARTALSRTEVRFREIDPAEASDYWQSGEPCDKAGAYAIQGKGGVFVAGLSGSYSGVVGLPVFETAQMLSAAGIDVLCRRGTTT